MIIKGVGWLESARLCKYTKLWKRAFNCSKKEIIYNMYLKEKVLGCQHSTWSININLFWITHILDNSIFQACARRDWGLQVRIWFSPCSSRLCWYLALPYTERYHWLASRYMMVCHAVLTYKFGDRRLWQIIHFTTVFIALAMGAGSFFYRWKFGLINHGSA